MNDAPAKLKKLKELMDLATEGLTRAEFLESFQKVIDYAKKIQAGNEKEWSLIQAAFDMLAAKHEKLIKGKFNAAHVEHSSKISKALKEQEKGMKAVYDRAARLPEKGDKGDRGDDAVIDHDKIVADVIAKIPKPKDGYTPVKGKDYWDGTPGKQTIGWGAHPLRIFDDSGATIDKVARNIQFSTNMTTTRNADGTIVVSASGGSGFTALSATEIPNGNLKVFTFSSATAKPSYLVSDNVWLKATSAAGTVNWTWNNGAKQATLSVPPADDIWAIV